jgi:methylisocitrate lyase
MTEPTNAPSPGARFRLAEEKPLQVAGAINAYTARLAQATGFRALYLSGGGVAANSLGVPDLGISTMEDVLTDVRRITDATSLPLLVDIDTGWGGAFNIARTIRSMIKAGGAAVHIEDQVGAKRCGHRPGKELVPPPKWLTASRPPSTPAPIQLRHHGPHRRAGQRGPGRRHRPCPGLRRRRRRHDLRRGRHRTPMYTAFAKRVGVPILANITEFGQTPLFTRDELAAGRRRHRPLLLRRLPRHERRRAQSLRSHPHRRHAESVLPLMQSRADLYKYLDYHAYEQKLDQLFAKSKPAK